MVVCILHPEEANHRFSCSCLSQEIMQLGQAIFISFRLAKLAMWDSRSRPRFEVRELRFEPQIHQQNFG